MRIAPSMSAANASAMGRVRNPSSSAIGPFLVPRFVDAGHDVIVASRGTREPYVPHPAWRAAKRIEIDREAEDAAGTFGSRIAALEPDAVIDLICFTRDSAQQLVDALQ